MTRRSHFPAAGLLLPLLAALLVLPFLGSAAQADPDDPPTPGASGDPQWVAEQALETVEEILEPGAPAPVEPGLVAGETAPRDLTLALRDLAVSVDDLPSDKQDEAEAILARPTDRGSEDPDNFECFDTAERPFCYRIAAEEPYCLATVCVHYTKAARRSTEPNRVDGENDGRGGRWPGTDPAVPDYVEFVAATTQAVADRYVKAGYRRPAGDGSAGGGSDTFDVYIAELGTEGYYGYCTTDQRLSGNVAAPAYCVVDNNYKASEYGSLNTPAENLKVTAAHEYFHAVQFAYDVNEDAWIMEATATWAEDEVYDRVNDNRQYLPYGPLGRPAQSLDLFSGLTPYGSWIFFRFLTERFSKTQGALPVLVRQIWEKLAHQGAGSRDMYSVQAVRSALADRNTDLYTQFASFTAWNRRPSVYYDEGSAYRPAPLQGSYRLTPAAPGRTVTFRLDHLSARHFRFVPGMSGAWTLRMRLNLNSLGAGGFALVTIKPTGGPARVRKVPLDSAGNAVVAYPFGGRVDWVEVDAINASARYTCGILGADATDYTCAGLPRDDSVRQGIVVRAVRG